MADQQLIHDDMKLYITSDKFYLEPHINPTEVMVIDRITGQTTVEDVKSVKNPAHPDDYRPVCGFLGTIKLISGLYLVVAKYRIVVVNLRRIDREYLKVREPTWSVIHIIYAYRPLYEYTVTVGSLNGHDIYQLAGHDIIPFAKSTNHLTSKQVQLNSSYERLLHAALDAPGMYFSYGYDLTHTLQRLHTMQQDFYKMPSVTRADPRFLWNGHLLQKYKEPMFSRFALPLVQGFVSINRVMLEGHPITWALLSRRAVTRAGTRLFMRGIDAQGHVANFVETEQILEKNGEKTSFVQIRGSIPVYWSQYPDLMYKPPVVLSNEDHVEACTKHLKDLQQRYGNMVLVNLIDQSGKEQGLETSFRAAAAAAAVPGVRYEPFDFHRECSGMRYDRLKVLLDRTQHEQAEFNSFVSRGGSVQLSQSGVFRTNCVDCLDRTNVVQGLFAKTHLINMLRNFGVITSDQLPDNFVPIFNNVWADHADMISTQYSGTGALKTDFTRTGKRTKFGLVMDGVNSLTRYYKNNFCDGFRQDSIDLFLGKHTVTEGEGHSALCPLYVKKPWKTITYPSFLLVAVSMFFATAVLPDKYTSTVLLCLMVWGAAVGATVHFIFRSGKEFVDWPRLDSSLSTTRANAISSSL